MAVVHDWFQGYHGSERVVNALVEGVLAEARVVDVLTFHAARDVIPPSLSSRIVTESQLASLPGLRQRGHDRGRWRYLLPYMPLYFRRLDLRGYDLVVASSHAVAHQVRPPDGTPFACYCHSPMRYAWTPEVDRERVSGAKAVALRAVTPALRHLDRAAAQRPDRYFANSVAVRERISRFYGREAGVVHPPVEVGELASATPKESGRFLWVGRLVAYKRPEVVIEAFRETPYRLTMVGVGPLEERLRADLPPNVEIRGWIPRSELRALYASASGFIHVAEEDFGISMVEALAAGTPVIALAAGGAKDIVRDGIDGVLVTDATADRIRAAAEEVSGAQWDRSSLAARAGEFSREKFEQRMCAGLTSVMDEP